MTLVQHWKCDDNAASTTVVATVGTNGTLEGGDNTSAKTVAGPGGSITAGFDLNGTDDAITIAASGISFATSTAFSVSFWAEWDLSTGRVMGRSDGLTSRIAKTTDTNIAWVNSTGTAVNFTVPSLGTTAWCHVLITRTTGNSMRCFLNGTESSSGAQSAAGTFAPTYLGRQSSNFHDGKFAQVKIFDSDESANVAALYAEGVTSGTAYDETGKALPLLVLTGRTDVQAMLHSNVAVSLLSLLGRTDAQAMLQGGLAVPLLALLGKTEAQSMVQSGLATLILSLLGETDVSATTQSGVSIPILALTGETDLRLFTENGLANLLIVQTGQSEVQVMQEGGVGVPLLVLLGRTDVQAMVNTDMTTLLLAILGETDTLAGEEADFVLLTPGRLAETLSGGRLSETIIGGRLPN